MEGFKFIKIIFGFSVLLLVIFLISCQSPIFQIPYNAKNDLLTNSQYYGQYISKNRVGQNANEKLNVLITNDNGIGIYMWIGGSSFSDDNNFQVKNSNIDGEFPHYAFNNEEIVGTLTFISQTKINISFATMYKPNLNIQNIICNKTDNK